MRLPDISNRNGTSMQFRQRVLHARAILGPDEEQHEPAAAGAEELAADGARAHRRLVDPVDIRSSRRGPRATLQRPRLRSAGGRIDEIGRRRRRMLDRLIHHLPHARAARLPAACRLLDDRVLAISAAVREMPVKTSIRCSCSASSRSRGRTIGATW